MSASRSRIRLASVFLFAILLSCTDAATRIAYDLESGAQRLRASHDERLIVDHEPEPYPEGCSGGYTVQFSEHSSLVVWCQEAVGAPSHGSHTTTYHLRYVTVPRTIIIHKSHGQHAFIELAKSGDEISIVSVR